jgi:hypothetical protein
MIILKYIKNLIFDNIVKCLLTIACITCIVWAKRIPDSTSVDHVIVSFKDNGRFNYVTSGSGKESYSVKTFAVARDIDTNGNIQYNEMHGGACFLYAAFGVILLVLIIMTFINDDDAGWNFKENWKHTLEKEVRCDVDTDGYNYSLCGKLLVKSDKIIDSYQLKSYVNGYYHSKNIYPDNAGTKSQIRDTKIKDIVT